MIDAADRPVIAMIRVRDIFYPGDSLPCFDYLYPADGNRCAVMAKTWQHMFAWRCDTPRFTHYWLMHCVLYMLGPWQAVQLQCLGFTVRFRLWAF